MGRSAAARRPRGPQRHLLRDRGTRERSRRPPRPAGAGRAAPAAAARAVRSAATRLGIAGVRARGPSGARDRERHVQAVRARQREGRRELEHAARRGCGRALCPSRQGRRRRARRGGTRRAALFRNRLACRMAAGLASAEVTLRGLSKRFDDVVAVDSVDLHVSEGEFLSLLGPSGCGKTTTLRLIAGFEQPDEGSIEIGGEDVSRLPPYRRDVNTVFQSYALFPHLKVLDNVAYGLKQRGFSKEERRERARAMLELVHLPDIEARKPRQLSGGQQQRVALARALVMEPKVLLLDEPLGALDLKVRRQLQIELKRIQETVGVTFVYVTHDQEEALAMSDRVAVMSAGRIEQVGTPREIYDSPSSSFVADFIGETNFIKRDGTMIAVRPERVQLRPETAGGGEGIAGEVVTTMVIGPAVQCLVRGDDGQEVLVRQQRDGGESPLEGVRAGERVHVEWSQDAALVLAEEREGTGS